MSKLRFLLVGFLCLTTSMLYLSRQLIFASMSGSTLYEQRTNMERQLARWKKNRDQSINGEAERYKTALETSTLKETQRIQKITAEADTSYYDEFETEARTIKIQSIKEQHTEELRLLEIEHRLERERIEEAMATKVVLAVQKRQAQHMNEQELSRIKQKTDEYRARSQDILSWYCTLSQTNVDLLLKNCQRLESFASETICLKGDEGLPMSTIPPLTLTPNKVNNEGLKHMAIVKFDSPVISRAIASLAKIHIANRTRTVIKNEEGHLPPSEVYRGATVMMHPWLGLFYRVRVPALGSRSGGDRGGVDQHSYRQECFRRPWAFLDIEDRRRFSLTHKKAISASLRATSDPPNPTTTASTRYTLRAILMLHGQSRMTTIMSLVQSIYEMKNVNIKVQLIVTLCPMNDCITKKDIVERWKKKLGTELPTNVLVHLPPKQVSGENQPKHDLWLTWQLTLLDVLSNIDVQNNDGDGDGNGKKKKDIPIVLLDGHTSTLDNTFLDHVGNHLHATSSGRHAVLPMSTYNTPTHRWKEIYFDQMFKNGKSTTAQTTAKGGGYTKRFVMPIAFMLQDGLAAMSAWPEDNESGRASGSGIAACGRVTLAWVFQSRLNMNLRRSMVEAPELHGWNSIQAEKAAANAAIDIRKKAAKEHHHDIKRIQKIRDASSSSSSSSSATALTTPTSAPVSSGPSIARLPLFFPKDMSPIMVSPETPATSSEFCNLALDALGLCDTCTTDVNALMTYDVTETGRSMLMCSSLLGDDSTRNNQPMTTTDSQVYRTLNPLHGLSFDTNGDTPLHYEWSLGEPDVFV